MTQRIAKIIAQNGHCSRRQAEELINQGKVFLNNQKVLECATFVKAGDTIRIDRKTIQVDFKSIASREIKLFMMNKPTNTICTEIDEVDRQRQTVVSLIPKKLGRLIMVGRLDYNSEGLLLFTNDGHFAEFLMHPRTKLKRLYKVRITGQLNDEAVKKLERGLKIKHELFRPIKVIERKGKKEAKNSWVMLELTEGKNREIRKAMEHLGHEVSRLVRVAYADLALGSIPKGELVEINPELFKELVESFKQSKK
ncbi:MAG: rRNA pseudouridine synthase [Proteobacteria bacterium]|nr:rRNA pseudouridine synthase [Pseudomonadota bacterium]